MPACACRIETPGFRRAMGTSQCMLGVSQTRAAEGVVKGDMVKGINASASDPLKMPPNPFSAIPAMAAGEQGSQHLIAELVFAEEGVAIASSAFHTHQMAGIAGWNGPQQELIHQAEDCRVDALSLIHIS